MTATDLKRSLVWIGIARIYFIISFELSARLEAIGAPGLDLMWTFRVHRIGKWF